MIRVSSAHNVSIALSASLIGAGGAYDKGGKVVMSVSIALSASLIGATLGKSATAMLFQTVSIALSASLIGATTSAPGRRCWQPTFPSRSARV